MIQPNIVIANVNVMYLIAVVVQVHRKILNLWRINK